MEDTRKNLFQQYLELAYLPSDTEEQRINKGYLMLMASHFTLVSLVTGTMFYAYGLLWVSYLPYSYTVISTISLLIFFKTKGFNFFKNTQLCLLMFLPFFIHLVLGGFITSSVAVIWSIVSPLAALFFITIRQSVYWFGAYMILIFISFLLDDKLMIYDESSIPTPLIDSMYLINIGGVSILIFLVQLYFVKNERSLKGKVEEQNERLEIQSTQLMEMDKIKSNFFANISHEFRTPLTLIQGILRNAAPINQEDRSTMQRNADRLLQLINQLLDLTKLESGKMQLKKKTIDLTLEARNIAQLFGSTAKIKAIQFRFNGSLLLHEKTESVLAELDPVQIQKVLANLISNAVKFCPEGGEIDIHIKNENDAAKIIISNTGEDIPAEQLQEIFNRFHQVESDSTRGYEGTGIGLSLVHEIVTLHGGQISVTSRNQIVRFEVTLPRGQIGVLEKVQGVNHLIMSSPQLKAEAPTIKEKKPLKILVVEDYPDLRVFINRILHKSYSVIEASNGVEGVQLALEETPDLIISDIMMPQKDGIQLCTELKSHPATNHIPIILLTARAAKKDKFIGLDHGADDYLTKPFDESELLVRIRNLLQIRKKLQQKYQKEIWLKPSEVKVTSTQEKFLQQLKEILEKNLSNEVLTAEYLAKTMALSRSQFHRKLKALTNQSTTEFIRTYRLERGAELLKQKFGNVSEVAYEVGFSNRTYFSTCFQKHFGCPPSEYINFKKEIEN